MTPKLKALYEEIAALTKPKCGQCRVPHGCCNKHQCELTERYAAEMGVMLQRTDHPDLPFLGKDGCVVPPHHRPICSVHVCENHIWSSEEFHDKYFQLRDAICQLECGADEYPFNCAECQDGDDNASARSD